MKAVAVTGYAESASTQRADIGRAASRLPKESCCSPAYSTIPARNRSPSRLARWRSPRKSYARHVHDPGDLSWIGRHIKAVRSRSALGSTVKYIAADAIIFRCSDETMYSAR